MNMLPGFMRLAQRRRQPDPNPRYWVDRIPLMQEEEAMSKFDDVERGIAQLVNEDRRYPRDLDDGRPLQVPPTPDLFADGIEIAQAVLDWEQRAGQPIGSLIEHLKAERQLRESVVTKAKQENPVQEPST